MRGIYLSAGMKHHEQWYHAAKEGLNRHGVKLDYGNRSTRVVDVEPYDFLIFLGPNYWKKFEQCGKDYLLIGRGFLGDHPYDERDRTCWSWNGYNGHGIFNVREQDVTQTRLRRLTLETREWRLNPDGHTLIMGQYDTGRCGQYHSLKHWYDYVANSCLGEPLFRAWEDRTRPLKKDLDRNVRCAVTLNSTVACKTLALGCPTVTCHDTNPVWAATSHEISKPFISERRHEMLCYLAHCQYHEQEVRSGFFWEVLGPGPRGPRLCDIDLGQVNVEL